MSKDILVHIIGSGHSGSTLLDMMLGGHSAISSIGESPYLRYNTNFETESDYCTCGKRVMACPFWSAVDAELRVMLGTGERPALPDLQVSDIRVASLRDERGRFINDINRPFPYRSRLNEILLVLGSRPLRRLAAQASSEVAMHRESGKGLGLLYRAIRKAHGTPIIVDSTKDPGTFKNVWIEAGERDMRFILLVRDGRAVTASRMRRDGFSMKRCAEVWRTEHLKRIAAQFTARRAPRRIVHYEDLATDPEKVLRGLCDWLGLDFEPAMLEFRENRHNVGGNPMRFRKTERSVTLDERWRDELGAEDLATFERIAGRLNRSLGYGD